METLNLTYEKVIPWFKEELMENSQPAIQQIEDEEERIGRDFERRAAIESFSILLERAILDELNKGEKVSLEYRDEEGNLLKDIANKSLVEETWIPGNKIDVRKE